MSEFNVGTARGVIELDYRGQRATEEASKDIEGLQKGSEKGSAAIQQMGTASAVAGAGIAASLGVALSAASNFEKGLSGIQAVSGATTSEMDAVRKKALQLGQDTAFSASESASAIEELVKAGITVPDVLNGAADAAVALAAAGEVALPEAATIAANAMNQFGLAAEQMPGIADKIAGAANASAIDVSDFGQSMTQVGAVANTVGLSFDDTALAITAMGNAGIKGSDAGTSLKTMLMNLQPQTKKQIALAKQLGIVTKDGGNAFFDAKGQIKSMSDIAGVLGNSLKGMSEKQKLATLETLFGSDAIRAAAIIADNGAKGMDNLAGSIGKISAADVAKTRLDNMAGSVEQLKGSAETFAIQLGTIMIPMIRNLIDNLTGAVNWFSNLSNGQQKAIVVTAATVAGILLLLGAFIKVVAFVKTLVAAVKAVQAAWVALNISFSISPIGLIIIAIIALIAGLVLLYKKNETFRNFVNKAWASIKAAIGAVVDWITGTAVPWIVNAWNTIKDGAQALWSNIVSIWNSIKDGVATAINGIKSVVQAVWSFITGYIKFQINLVKSIVTTVLNAIKAYWTFVWGVFGPLIKAVWDLIKAIVEVGLFYIKAIIERFMRGIQVIWTAIWNAIKAVVLPVWNFIKSVVTTGINTVNNIVRSVMARVRAVWTTVWNAIKAVAARIWAGIRNVIINPIVAVYNKIRAVINLIRAYMTAGFNIVKAIVANVWSNIVSVISSKIDAVKSRVKGMIDTVRGFFSGAGTWLLDAGKRIIQGLIDGIRSMVGNVTGAISGITDKIRGFLPGSPIKEGPLKEHGWNDGEPGKRLVQNLAGGIESGLPDIAQAFAGLPTEVPVTLGSPDVALAASASRTASGATGASTPSGPGDLRLIRGTLGIDPSGRAFISGVAQEVVDNDKSFAGTTGRMGGF